MGRPQKKGLDYFPHDVDFFSDKKIKILKSRYGADGIVIYEYILCEIYKDNGYFLKVDNDFEYLISNDLNMKSDKVKQVINFLLERSLFNNKLFQSDKVLTSAGIQKRFQEAVKSRASKKTINVDQYWLLEKDETASYIKVTYNQGFSEINKSFSKNNDSFSTEKHPKEKESKEKKSKVNNNMCKADAYALFEKLWEIYPVKKGKGQISDAKKLKLLKIGYDEMERAINRYVDYVNSLDYLKFQNGSTFFNSGYIDYLDENYSEKEPETKKTSKLNLSYLYEDDE